MTPRRFILIPVIVLFIYLGTYTWNQRTGFLDNLATQLGLETVGAVLKPVTLFRSTVENFWDKYFDLVSVREENERLKTDIIAIHAQIVQAGEDRAEAERLRKLLSMPPDEQWRSVGARVLAGRMGPNSVLETVTINRGYLAGGLPGTPLATELGLVGRVLRASATTATALLLTDPGSRIAVLSQNTRAPGVLSGRGARHPLEMRFVARNSEVETGELLVTSGLDGVYPKGIPVARVVSVAPSDYSQFMSVLASPLVDVDRLEEVLLLERSVDAQVNPFGPDESPTMPIVQAVNPELIGPVLPPPPPKTVPGAQGRPQ
ncbi:MAG: rod shape-determining protein MreC [Desulfovibrionaceae bacterium]